MGALQKLLHSVPSSVPDMASLSRFLHQRLVFALAAFFISFSSYLLSLFSFMRAPLSRLKRDGGHCYLNCHSSHPMEVSEENKNEELIPFLPETGSEDVKDFAVFACDGETEKSDFHFEFRFPTYEEFSTSMKENDQAFSSTSKSFGRICEYQFKSGFSISGFIEEPETHSCDINGVNGKLKVDSFEDECVFENGIPLSNDLREISGQSEIIQEDEEERRNPAEGISQHCDDDKKDKSEFAEFTKAKESLFRLENQFISDQEFSDEFQSNSEKDSSFTESDSASISFDQMRSLMSRLIDSPTDGFLTDDDFGGEFDFDALKDMESGEIGLFDEVSDVEEDEEYAKFDEDDDDVMEELRELEEEHFVNPNTVGSEFLSEKDFDEKLQGPENEEFDAKQINNPENSDESKSKHSTGSYSGDTNKLESLWEHQELIEQLKMELRKVRDTGLPTILEESESPKIMDDLKPWKIDDRFQREDCMGELHKIYKSYRERMRKFDILNYQKMYAIGFLKLKDPQKDPLQSLSSHKSSGPTLKSLLSQNGWLFKNKSHESEPMIKFVQELQSELEVVYVGQMCLSWEFLHWQYMKALDLWDSDPRGIQRYNEVAGEFQQFQVLMQRFIEEERFQGPRVQNYIKSRCVFRNLLQVPVIREDGLKDRKKARKKERCEYAITSDELVEMVEESIRIFWQFVRADKDCSSITVKGQKGKLPELQSPGDMELLMEIRKSLQKKEKKLKDLLRSENCILRRIRKSREDDSDHVLYFFSQVDMKLVARVLNMSRISTEQLVWCHNKLGKISFVRRRIHVEPSFSLFPC